MLYRIKIRKLYSGPYLNGGDMWKEFPILLGDDSLLRLTR
jgi:hypothetical protein